MTDKILNILFIGSSDMEVSSNDLINNYDRLIKNYIFPCKSIKLKNGKCINCKLSAYEHKIGYSINEKHYYTVDEIITQLNEGKNVGFSDLWKSKYVIFKKIRELLLGKSKQTKKLKTINIEYDTVDPLFQYNNKLLPIIEKINNDLALKFGFNSIKPSVKHVYSKTLLGAKLDKQYDLIFLMNAGVGWLYTPKNIAKIYKHLNNGGLLCNMYSNLRRKELDLDFVDFLAVCKSVLLDTDKTSIINYAKFMVKYQYLKFLDNGIYCKLEPPT
jgi:hypothetical protein